MAATLVGIGLARFAYVPLFPAMVAAGWTGGGGAGLLGAANLGGYLAGALGGRRLVATLGTARSLDAAMAAATIAFAACAWNGGLAWLMVWRTIAGVAGGVLMALAGPAVQAAVDAPLRGRAGGIVVSGVGVGIVLASVVVPLALHIGLPTAWLGLTALAAGLWAFAHPRWPRMAQTGAQAGAQAGAHAGAQAAGMPSGVASPGGASPIAMASRPGAMSTAGLTARLHVVYGLSGAGMTPPMVYLADLALRGRHLGSTVAALAWVLFGVGALAGTLAGGRACDRWGAATALKIWLAVQTAALVLALLPGAAALGAAGLLGGFAGVGISAVALARARELAGAAAGTLWARATAVYAVCQSITAFALAALFARTASHDLLFAAGLALSLTGLALSAIPSRPTRSAP